MKIEYKEIKKRFFQGGAELASFAAKYPYAEEYESISRFYGELAENSYNWFCDEFLDRCKQEYESNSDRTKRFDREIYRYTAVFFVSEEKEGEELSVSLDVTLRKGKRDIVAELHEIHSWNRETQLLTRKKKNRA